jgi:RHS repeat-associated protein
VFNLRFAGQYADQESGLFYNHFRDGYSPRLGGQFTQSDPIGLQGGQFSTFGYVGGNPVSRNDPTGLIEMYGNWGGANWSGGKNSSTIPLNPAGPKDSLDACFVQHDYCYAKRERKVCTAENVPSEKHCDTQLVSCMQSTGNKYLGTYGDIFKALATTYFVFKGAAR